MKGSIRIIGGKYRGRKLPVLDEKALRPTTDRVKETVFNWLMPITQDAICLDCFAGSGSLGFEAASRGAKKVVLLEKNPLLVSQLRANQTKFNNEMITIHKVDTLSWLSTNACTQFNLVFIDPPFHQSLVNKAIHFLEQKQWLTKLAFIYVETEINCQFKNTLPDYWRLHREKITGQVHSHLFIRETE